MVEPHGPLKVARIRREYKTAGGEIRHYESALLRQSWKQDGTVKHRTVASLADTPKAQVDALEAVLNRGAAPGGNSDRSVTLPPVRR